MSAILPTRPNFTFLCADLPSVYPVLFPALPASVLSHLMPYILTDPESTSDSQPKNTRFLRIPKHFPEYIEEGGWVAPFLGASIVGKVSPLASLQRVVKSPVQIVI